MPKTLKPTIEHNHLGYDCNKNLPLLMFNNSFKLEKSTNNIKPNPGSPYT